ncbi:hypothetical protein [Salinirarus marinus]|uniref:hypothetical protein n=1 Tax=Salinirarus marinus TaxID=3068310 RepID=UPI003C6C365B
MQRRAAAIYVVFFVVIGAASYSLIATADAPAIQFQNPEYRLSSGDQFTVDGRQHTVSEINAEMTGGGHGTPATLTRSGTIAWTNQSARYTESWDNNSTVTVQGEDYRVLVENAPDPTSFVLQETVNRTRILQEDPAVRNETVTQNGTEYVVEEENGNLTLTPAADYFPVPEETSYAEGDRLQYNDNATTVDAVTNSSVTLAWNAPRQNTVDVGDQANVTLSGQTYLAYFPDNSTLVLTQNFESYDRQTEVIDTYQTHVNGLWGISIVSFLTAIVLLGMAYMPSRY